MEEHFEHKYKREYDTIDNLVEDAVFYGMVQREDKDTIIAHIKGLYRDGYFYEPTDIRVDENEDGITVRVPLTLRALKGILEQGDKEKQYIKNKSNPSDDEPQQVNNDSTKSEFNLPTELDTEEARIILSKTIELGLCDNNYNWLKTTSLFGYYVDVISEKLDIRQSNGRIIWKPFIQLFKMNDKKKATARQAINDYKTKQLSPPEGDDIVNKLLK